ncbi:MAG: DUF4140 domain-containing protein, partial [Chitinophagaceae bacterium]|nr:DUF4140 domain-containing protein [Chitinophagaceae bacterium]
MRMIFLLLLLLHFGSLGSFGQTKKVIETKIEKVTLYREGAQVERTYRGLIGKGKHLLVFENISPDIDKQSIQVQTDTTVVVYSVLHQLNFLREQMKSNEITQWEEEKLVLEEKIAFEKNLQAVLDQEQT